jgi:DNA-binding MarR family transcriptional regulator
MNNYPKPEECYKLWILLAQTREAMLKARTKELSQYGITPRQSAVLHVIKAIGDKATPSEISRWLFREPHTVASILNTMEKRGLIKRTKDLERKNMIRVSITEKGEQAYSYCSKRESPCKLFSALSREQRSQLETCLRILRKVSLEEIKWEDELPFP